MASEAPPLLFAANKSFFVRQQQKQTKQQHKNPKNQKHHGCWILDNREAITNHSTLCAESSKV